MPYTPPAHLAHHPWEQYRQEMGIESISSGTRPGIVAGFQQWQAQKQLQERYKDVTNFGSPLYQQYRSFLEKATPQIGTNTLLAPLMAGGGNFGASQVQANALRDELGKERTDAINTGTQGFALGMQGQAGGLLGQFQQGAQFTAEMAQRKKEFEESNEAGIFDYLSAGLPILGSIGLAPFTGGASMAGMATSDRRLKENIEKVGISPSGVNVYEFNYKGGDTRYRGAMADENPEASIERNGIKYLDYSKIDVNFEVI